MAVSFPVVAIATLSDNGQIIPKFTSPGVIQIADEIENISIKYKQDVSLRQPLLEIKVYKDTEAARCGSNYYMINATDTSWFISFSDQSDLQRFGDILKNFKSGKKNSLFAQRTDDASATQYFQFYGYLSQQQNMMQDYIRTSTYQRAIHSNLEDFKDKVVLDVGAGSGILSFFAQQARARKVYAVEASSMAKHAETLVFNNKKQDTIVVIPGKIEEINLPELVDVIISEPMGYMLFNERMLETYLHAKKWLKPNGKMFPTQGDLHIAPFSDAGLYMEQLNKANFWYQLSFHGVDLSSLRDVAAEEYFKQPIVDAFDMRICTAKSVRHTVNFLTANEADLHRIEIPLHFHILQTADVHGLAFWFDVAFIGSKKTLWLSTSPTQPLTHWYQVRCLLATPLFAERGQILTGHVLLISNKRQSYDVEIELCLEGASLRSQNTLDLKNPFFRYSGQAPQPPPGTNETSPSEAYWQTLGMTNGSDMVLTNGVNTPPNAGMGMVNGSGDMMDVTHNLAAYSPQQPAYNLGSLPSPGAMKNSASVPPTSQRVAAPVSAPSSSIGGGISPSLFSQQHQQVVMGHTSHFPVSNNLMIGDYVTPGNNLAMHTSLPPYKP